MWYSGIISPCISVLDLSSKSHRRFRRLFPFKSAQTKKENDKNAIQSATDLNSNLKWVASAEEPKDAVSSITLHLLPQCEFCFFDKDEMSCITLLQERISSSVVSYNVIMFLVNKDNFEMMEWKKCTNRKLPHVLLALNTGFKMQHLNIVEYFMSSVVTSENLELQAVQTYSEIVNQNIDKTTTYQTGRTHTFGVNAEIAVCGKILTMASMGGKFGLKYDYSRSRSNTTSVVEKTLHSEGMEVEVPPNHSCTIEMTRNTFTAEVTFTGEMTRMYKNNEIRKTFIHQEVVEIQMPPCPAPFVCLPYLTHLIPLISSLVETARTKLGVSD
uniref:Uncharacterized protein n=1 Tax=Sinocyclocheilus grahami TaxID=75366 RepID=A0A672L6K0_SINGR